MLRLEDFMEIQGLYQQGLGVSEIARRLGFDRKTVRKYLRQPPQPYSRPARTQKIDPYRAYLRERWEKGVTNAYQLFREIVKRGYAGGVTQVGRMVQPWRSEGQERAFVRFETAPGEQSQMDWGHFGNWSGSRLYAFALMLCYSRMRYVEFTQRQDSETLLNCLVHVFHYFGGVTASVLTDNMKTVVLERVEGQPQWNPRFLDFAAYYGFVPWVCHPYRHAEKLLCVLRPSVLQMILLTTVAITESILCDQPSSRDSGPVRPESLRQALDKLRKELRDNGRLDKNEWAIQAMHEARILRNCAAHGSGVWSQSAACDFEKQFPDAPVKPSPGEPFTISVDDIFAYRRAAKTILNEAERLQSVPDLKKTALLKVSSDSKRKRSGPKKSRG